MRIWVSAVFLVAACATAPEPFANRFEASPCPIDGTDSRVRCGRIEVPENYAAPDGRRIALNVAIVPAIDPRPGAPPLYFIDGGPGDPATRRIRYYLEQGALYRQHRDIVLFDQRGSGLSHPLHCPEISFATDPNAPMYPAGSVARCAELLSAQTDLSQFNTANSARDIDAVRAALGHETIDLYAASYGTTLSMAYMDLAPERVHAAVLVSALPWAAMPPQYHATAAARALTLTLAACAADAACHAAYPDLPGDLERARARTPQTVASPRWDMFMESLRRTMYRAEGVRRAPQIIHRVAMNGIPQAEAAAPAAPPREPQPDDFADGLYLSVSCAESLLRIPYERAAAAARQTPFNDYRLSQQRAACVDWGVRPATDHAPDLRRVRAPVLLVSGNFDPVTPPDWAADVATQLPNARQLMLAEGAHVSGALTNFGSCLDALQQRFYETADLDALDTTCVNDMRAPAWATD